MPNGFTLQHVLVIDDERLIRWAIARALSVLGRTVVEAFDGTGGLRAVTTASRPFLVIFLGFCLPDSNDFTLLTAIRTAPNSAVVLMTASGTPEAVTVAYGLGVHRVLNKRFDIVEVRHIVAATSAASRTLRGDAHGSTRDQRIPVSLSMDPAGYRNAPGTVDVRDLSALS